LTLQVSSLRKTPFSK